MKRRIFALALALALWCGLLALPASAAYADVPAGSWYSADLSWVTQRALLRDAISGGAFSPDSNMSRAALVSALCRMSCSQGGSYPAPGFSDVKSGDWCYTAVAWGKSIGMIDGTSATAFSPGDAIAREDLCKLIARYLRYMGRTLPETQAAKTFTDQAAIRDYASSAVAACQRAGFVDGYEDGSFRPRGSVTRAEAVSILARVGRFLESTGFRTGLPPVDVDDWRLLLVNPWNPVPSGYVSTISLKNTRWDYEVDARIYDDLMAMVNAMWRDGLSPYINSAFRTNSFQRTLFNRQISKYRSYGYSYAAAEELASHWVARPGTSEHEIGLAIDFNMDSSWGSTRVKNWLADYGWMYGFIYRYPADKVAVTGINPEPWHFRYVGREYAGLIHNEGCTLEEFLDLYR